MVQSTQKVALLGNPNSGKSSLFNLLTGLRQKTGNFPGVTVERKFGIMSLPNDNEVQLVDFPGSYSLYPTAADEKIVTQTLCNPEDQNFPDLLVYVVDVTQLEQHLLLFTQLLDLHIPVVLVLNMIDLAEKDGLTVYPEKLEQHFGSPVVAVSARKGRNIEDLKLRIQEELGKPHSPQKAWFYPASMVENKVAVDISESLSIPDTYRCLQLAHHVDWIAFLDEENKRKIEAICQKRGFESIKLQVRETMARYDHFLPVVKTAVKKPPKVNSTFTERIDRIITHKVLGPIIFVLILLFLFQAIFAWAALPMDFIDGGVGTIQQLTKTLLGTNWVSSLLADGLIAGIGGILIFIPQIAILFFLISLLEESGYMARAVFIFDRIMQSFGLNGRSLVSLISGGACAIPAIMAARTISNWKERLITILVTPLISCSARIPVYIILIGLVVPFKRVLGVLNLQGLIFMGFYVLGALAALAAAFVFKLILKDTEKSYLIIELPTYRWPSLKNALIFVKSKVATFVWEAGKVILVISLILWVISTYGPPESMKTAEADAKVEWQAHPEKMPYESVLASKKLEASYAGQIGKYMEPAIEPLGFDWKIGIALLTSFAAREVFVGTIATLYSLGSDEEDSLKIRERMRREINPKTGRPVYTFATAMSLLVFYVFAMQCMSTLAVVKKETQSWKWPVVQFLFMTLLAYLASLATYQFLG